MNKRASWIDYAKAIGIVLVVYGHVARGLFAAGIPVDETFYKLADSIIYSFHMPLFFFLSGLFFIHSLKKRGAKGVVFSKMDTILYPYILWSLIQGTIEATLSNYTNGFVTYIEVVQLWMPRAQFWFLYALFIVFVLSGIIYSVLSISYSAIIFIMSSVLYIFSASLPDVPFIGLVSENYVFFMLGIVCSRYEGSIYKKIQSKLFLSAIFVAFLLSQYIFHFILDKTYKDIGILSLILAIVSITLVSSISVVISLNRYRFISLIGASSMAIYLMHILVVGGVRVVLDKIFNVESYIIYLTIGTMMGVVVPLIALAIINKFKINFLLIAPLSKVFSVARARLRS